MTKFLLGAFWFRGNAQKLNAPEQFLALAQPVLKILLKYGNYRAKLAWVLPYLRVQGHTACGARAATLHAGFGAPPGQSNAGSSFHALQLLTYHSITVC